MAAVGRRWALDSQLLVAIQTNDVPRATQLFRAGVDTDVRFSINSQQRPALCLCVQNNHHDMVKLLVGLGASINQGDSEGLTPLHIACSHGYPQLATLLLSARAHVNARTHHRRTPLHLAANHGSQVVAELLLSYGAKVDVVDEDGYSPLHCASSSGNSALVERLLSKKAIAGLEDCWGCTALHYAVDVSGLSPSTVSKLALAHPAAAASPNAAMDTPLHIAVRSGRPDAKEVVEAVLGVATRAALNSQGARGHTPLHLAVLERQVDLVRLLLTAGAEVNTENHLGHTPLVSAARDTTWGAVALLLAAGARTKRLVQGGAIEGEVTDPGIRALLVDATRQPPHLSGLCRRALTLHLGPAALSALRTAALPTKWHDFLTYHSLNL